MRSDFIVNKLHFERVDFYEGHYKTELAKSIKEQAEKRKLMEKVNVKKKTHNIFFRFKDKNVPTGPPENILNAIRDKSISPARYANIKEVLHIKNIDAVSDLFEFFFSYLTRDLFGRKLLCNINSICPRN